MPSIICGMPQLLRQTKGLRNIMGFAANKYHQEKHNGRNNSKIVHKIRQKDSKKKIVGSISINSITLKTPQNFSGAFLYLHLANLFLVMIVEKFKGVSRFQ